MMKKEQIEIPNALIRPQGWSAEKTKKQFEYALSCNVLAYTLADAANTFFVDMDFALKPLGKGAIHQEKVKFRELKQAVAKAKYWSEQCRELLDAEDNASVFQHDSDFIYNLMKLIQDRLGSDEEKTRKLIKYLDRMPSEGFFNIGLKDFMED